MKRVLITGMSGTGKSTLLAEFAARGYRTVDTDYGDYYETVGGERLWREDRIDALLSSAADELPGVLFVQGTTRNQGLFYPRFHRIVLLSAPADVLVERLATRGANPYGKDPAELAETLDNLRTVEPLLRASATLEVVTTVPVAHVADVVLAHVLLPRFGRQRLMAGARELPASLKTAKPAVRGMIPPPWARSAARIRNHFCCSKSHASQTSVQASCVHTHGAFQPSSRGVRGMIPKTLCDFAHF